MRSTLYALVLLSTLAGAAHADKPRCNPDPDVEAAVAQARFEHGHPKDKIDALFGDAPFDEAATRAMIQRAVDLCRQQHREYELARRAAAHHLPLAGERGRPIHSRQSISRTGTCQGIPT